jgi:hypothetical protein
MISNDGMNLKQGGTVWRETVPDGFEKKKARGARVNPFSRSNLRSVILDLEQLFLGVCANTSKNNLHDIIITHPTSAAGEEIPPAQQRGRHKGDEQRPRHGCNGTAQS